jgi:Glycosyl transferase family 2
MEDFAPIVIFAYRRPEHLRATLDSLARCKEFASSKIVVFCDGAKTAEDRDAVDATRRVAQAQLGARAEYRFRETNAGLATSIIEGVTEATRRFGRAIVLEDDLQLSANFLAYMNSALKRYEDEPRVLQISGQLFNTPEFHERDTAIFLPFTTSWGWGTWRRAWEMFDPSARDWEQLKRDRALRHRFNLDGSYDYSTMLQRQMSGLGDSWAIRWYWSVFRNDGIVCFPPVSLVQNTGLDGSGTHGRGSLRKFKSEAAPARIGGISLPGRAEVKESDFELVKKAIWRQNGGYLGSAVDMVRRRLFALTGKHM